MINMNAEMKANTKAEMRLLGRILKRKDVETEEFTILEDLDLELEHLSDDYSRIDAAHELAKTKYGPRIGIYGNTADNDKRNGLTVAVVGNKRYLVFNPGTNFQWYRDIMGEYIGTLRFTTTGSWTWTGCSYKIERAFNHIHLYKYRIKNRQ
jgi:hypothetical protein